MAPLLTPMKAGRVPRRLDQAFNDAEKQHLASVYQKRRWAVCQIKTPTQQGTGCLIGPNLIITNHHVIPNRGIALQSKAIFFFIANQDPRQRHTISEKHILDFDPSKGFGYFTTSQGHTAEELDPNAGCTIKIPNAAKENHLDYTIVALKIDPYLTKIQGSVCSIFDAPLTSPGKPICVIHHPQNPDKNERNLEYRKESEGRVVCNGPYSTYYNAYTAPGSSGGLVLDLAGYLVALHYQGNCGCECSQKHQACNSGILVNEIAKHLLVTKQQQPIQTYIVWAKAELNKLVPVDTNKISLLIDLPDEDPKFCGRSEELKDLTDLCVQHKRVAITGLGGVGKTALAVEYANQYKQKSELVYFIDGSDPTTIEQGLLRLAEDLKIVGDKPSERLENLKVWFRSHSNCLLVFDGVDSSEGFRCLEANLPIQISCVIITTRMSEEGACLLNCASMVLGQFSMKDALSFIEKQLSQRENAEQLADQLGCLPLALTHAASYIRQRNIHINSFLDSFKDRQTKLFGESIVKPTKEQTILTTWSMSLCFMSAETLDLFNFCSFLATRGIPRKLLGEWLKVTHPSKDIDELIKELRDYSMVGDDMPERYAIHKLVQQVIREKLSPSEITGYLLGAVGTLDGFADCYGYNPHQQKAMFTSMVPHLQAVLVHTYKLAVDSKRFWERVGNLEFYLSSYFFESACQYGEAQAHSRRALKFRKEVFGHKHEKIAQSFVLIGTIHRGLGQYQKALKYDRKALELFEGLKSEPLNMALAYDNLGATLGKLGEYDKALEYMEKALRLRKQKLGNRFPKLKVEFEGFPDGVAEGIQVMPLEMITNTMGESVSIKPCTAVAISYHNYGRTLLQAGRDQEGLESLKKALEDFQNALGKGHPKVAICHDAIGQAMEKIGQFQEAMDCFNKSLNIRKIGLGKNSREVAISYSNIGRMLIHMHKYEEAEKPLRDSVKLLENHVLEKHPSLAKIYSALGLALAGLNQYKKAIKLLKKSLKINKNVFEKLSQEVAMSYAGLGIVLRQAGQPKRSLKYQKKALKLLKIMKRAKHQKFAICCDKVSVELVKTGKLEESLSFLVKVSAISEEIFPETNPGFMIVGDDAAENDVQADLESPDLVQHKPMYSFARRLNDESFGESILQCLCRASELESQGQLNRALDILMEAQELKEAQGYLPLDSDTGHILSQMGDVLLQQGFMQEALKRYNVADISLGATLERFHVLKSIGSIYQEQGQFSEAAASYIDASSLGSTLNLDPSELLSIQLQLEECINSS